MKRPVFISIRRINDGALEGYFWDVYTKAIRNQEDLIATSVKHLSLLDAAADLLETLESLREEIAPLAAQILCPKDNTFSRQVKMIDDAIRKAHPRK